MLAKVRINEVQDHECELLDFWPEVGAVLEVEGGKVTWDVER